VQRRVTPTSGQRRSTHAAGEIEARPVDADRFDRRARPAPEPGVAQSMCLAVSTRGR